MTVVSNTVLFNVRAGYDLYNPLRDVANTQFYVFSARHTAWANTSVPNPITESVRETEYTIFDEMIFGKLITPDDVKMMVDRNNWTSGTKYAQYDDQDADLYTKKFFVVSEESGYHVFKCLSNAGGAASTVQPLFSHTSADDEVYRTSDGYVWKYMYSIDSATFNKFATTNYIPVVTNDSVTTFATNGSIDTIILSAGGNNYNSIATGYFSAISIGNTTTHAVEVGSTSSNANFYVGSAIYIDAGPGEGQVREIVDYNISANQHQVVIASEFSVTPTIQSRFVISPYVKISGDGTNASAISVVNTTSKAIEYFEVITGGEGYTYADITVTGNTGTSQANNAVARAIISPRGGHGSDVYTELNANKIGISVSFSNNESNTISSTNEYTRIGILKAPRLANVSLTLGDTSGVFQDGETVVQVVSTNNAIDTFVSTVAEYVYNVSDYLTLSFSGATTLVANDIIYQNTVPTANATVVNISGNTAVVRVTGGTFQSSATIFKTGNTAVTNSINAISAGLLSSVYGLDAANNYYSINGNNTIDVLINDQKIFNYAKLPAGANSAAYRTTSNTVVDLFNLVNTYLANTDVVTVKKYITTSLGQNTSHTAYGSVLSADSTSMLITGVSGMMTVGHAITGANSGATANVTAISGQSTVFNQTTKVTGIRVSGSFALDDYCQQDTPGEGGAYGYVQNIVQLQDKITANTGSATVTGLQGNFTNLSAGSIVTLASNSYVIGTIATVANSTSLTMTANSTINISTNTVNFSESIYYLTGVKGSFEGGANKYIQDASGNTVVSVSNIEYPDLIRYSGDIIYAENINPIYRSNTQSETIKLVIKFF